jgi:hypothetical protein
MKSFSEQFKDRIDATDGTVVLRAIEYKQIQHDAFKAGMLEAAEIVTKEIDYCAAPSSHEDMASAHKAILTAANNLKKEGM